MIDYLAIGHVTIDRLATGTATGGSAAYGATTAARLGLRTGILTAAGPDLDWPDRLAGISIARAPSRATTSFENLYRGGRRIQRLLSLADPLSPDFLPGEWSGAGIVHLAPVAHEIGGAFAGRFPGALVAITPQGLLRRWDDEGLVRQGPWAGDDRLLRSCQVAVFSADDLAGDEGFLARCVRAVPLVILTRGADGATLYSEGRQEHFAAFPVEEVDPTGAGDVFAAAFLIEYNHTGDPRHSAAFACCAASFAVQQPGLAGIPNRAAVERRLAVYRVMSDEG